LLPACPLPARSRSRTQIPDDWTRLSSELELPLKAFERMAYLVKTQDTDDFESAAMDVELPLRHTYTVYARLVGLLYQAKDPMKAKKFTELVLQNGVPDIEPRLLVGESLNGITKMVMDAYASFCDPTFTPTIGGSRKQWYWGDYVPPLSEWPVFAQELATV
jgi:hypothetical protein